MVRISNEVSVLDVFLLIFVWRQEKCRIKEYVGKVFAMFHTCMLQMDCIMYFVFEEFILHM
jgi:hypothetical protein